MRALGKGYLLNYSDFLLLEFALKRVMASLSEAVNQTSEAQVEQFRSFSKIYNNMSELCFNQCVWDFGTDQGAAVRTKLYRALHEKSETDGCCFHGVPARKQYAWFSGPVDLRTQNESCSFNKS